MCLWPLPGNCHPFVERWNCKEGTQISYKQMMRLNTKNSRMHVLKSPKYVFAQVECKEHCFFGGWSVQVIAESYYSKEVSKVSTCTWQHIPTKQVFPTMNHRNSTWPTPTPVPSPNAQDALGRRLPHAERCSGGKCRFHNLQTYKVVPHSQLRWCN